jgi:uncharacterized SAM-dependent methyltransferase
MFLSNTEIARFYNISDAAVNGWIKSAISKKNSIQLKNVNGKFKALDNPNNRAEFERLASQAQKYKPTAQLKKVQLHESFYEIFLDEEILQIAKDLEFKKLVNLKFWYKNGGAEVWDSIVKWRQDGAKKNVVSLTNQGLAYIDYLLSSENVNLIDIGQGNGYPSREFINNLKKRNILSKYIPIDISKEMINIAVQNLNDELKNIETVSYVRDFESTRFDTIIAENSNLKKETKNLILMLGNTICNQEEKIYTLKNISAGMEDGDIFLFTISLDKIQNRTDFKYVQYEIEDEIKNSWHFSLLGIDVDKCEINYYWDEINKKKVKTYILDKDYHITFNVYGQERIVKLYQGEQIIRWQHYLFDYKGISELLDLADLTILSYQIDQEKNNALIICGVK